MRAGPRGPLTLVTGEDRSFKHVISAMSGRRVRAEKSVHSGEAQGDGLRVEGDGQGDGPRSTKSALLPAHSCCRR